MHLSKNIRYLRKSKKMTQKDLAEHLGKSQTVIVSYESELSTPTFENLLKLSEVFAVSIDDLIFRDIERDGLRGPGPVAPGQKEDQDKALVGVIARLERYVARLEAEIKKRDPGLAEEMGIE